MHKLQVFKLILSEYKQNVGAVITGIGRQPCPKTAAS